MPEFWCERKLHEKPGSPAASCLELPGPVRGRNSLQKLLSLASSTTNVNMSKPWSATAHQHHHHCRHRNHHHHHHHHHHPHHHHHHHHDHVISRLSSGTIRVTPRKKNMFAFSRRTNFSRLACWSDSRSTAASTLCLLCRRAWKCSSENISFSASAMLLHSCAN